MQPYLLATYGTQTQNHEHIVNNVLRNQTDILNRPNYVQLLTFLYLSLNGEDVRLMLWDTAGQEEFDCITRAYYR